MQDDPYMDVIEERWAHIVLMYQAFKGKDQIIEYDVGEEKIYSYPAGEAAHEDARDGASPTSSRGHQRVAN